MIELWAQLILFIFVIFCIGFYCLIAKHNLLKLIIGVEAIAKAATLAFIAGGWIQKNYAISQALVITIILIEVVVVAVALSMAVNVYRQTGTLAISAIRRLKW
jgi:multicomponent Na+:H+ antiporter subunit C